MAFFLFLLVNVSLFLRPAEIVEEWKALPIYEVLIITCLIASLPKIIALVWEKNVRDQPLTLCVFGMFVAVVVSCVAQTNFEHAFTAGDQFLKIVVYYLLLVSLVDTPRRLHVFLLTLTVLSALMTLLVVLDYNLVIDLPGLKHTVHYHDRGGVDETVIVRLSGSGIFADPNDICALFAITIPLCAYWIVDAKGQLLRFFWLLPMGLSFYATYLTKSRGGFLAISFALAVVIWTRFGAQARWAILLLVFPLLLIFFAGRATDIRGADTAYHRFQLWQDAITALKHRPVFGIGADELAKDGGLVAHNSFIHAYAELGAFGGTIFFGAFFYAVCMMWWLNKNKNIIVDPTLKSLNPYLLGILAGYTLLMMSLSKVYEIPTYLMLGIITVQLRLTITEPYQIPLRLNRRMFAYVAAASVGFIIIMYVAMRILVRYG